MKRPFGLLIGLAALAAAGAASAQPGPEGFYATEIIETASGMELRPDGRFQWFFTTGALDLRAEGRWRQDGDDVLLDTEPPVTPPRFDYLGGGRDSEPALVVRVEDGSGEMPQYLDVEAEYDSGEPRYSYIDGDVYRFYPTPGRRIVAIRIGSGSFGFWSERYPVPDGASWMRFRLTAPDLGRADFRGARATVTGDALTLPLMGHPVRYRRLSAEETRELESAPQ